MSSKPTYTPAKNLGVSDPANVVGKVFYYKDRLVKVYRKNGGLPSSPSVAVMDAKTHEHIGFPSVNSLYEAIPAPLIPPSSPYKSSIKNLSRNFASLDIASNHCGEDDLDLGGEIYSASDQSDSDSDRDSGSALDECEPVAWTTSHRRTSL